MSDALTIALDALRTIRDMTERPADPLPADWREQVAACPECRRYKGHPIQQGICDAHRRPLWKREEHYEHERSALGYRMRGVAVDALSQLERMANET